MLPCAGRGFLPELAELGPTTRRSGAVQPDAQPELSAVCRWRLQCRRRLPRAAFVTGECPRAAHRAAGGMGTGTRPALGQLRIDDLQDLLGRSRGLELPLADPAVAVALLVYHAPAGHLVVQREARAAQHPPDVLV